MLDKQHPDYDRLQKKALEQLRSGKPLFGKDGASAPMLKQFIESALEAELDEHLDDEQRENGNCKNRKNSKRLMAAEGTLDIETPRDRDSSFELLLVKKLRKAWNKRFLGVMAMGVSPVIRKLIYTTNAIEGFHRQIRKVTKQKGRLPQIWRS